MYTILFCILSYFLTQTHILETHIWYSNHTKVWSFVLHVRLQTSFEYVNIFLNKPSKSQTHINYINTICNENETNIKQKTHMK